MILFIYCTCIQILLNRYCTLAKPEQGCQLQLKLNFNCYHYIFKANRWVKNMERDNGLQITKLNDAAYLRILENCIRLGWPMLIEDLGETIEATLSPVLLKQTFLQVYYFLYTFVWQSRKISPLLGSNAVCEIYSQLPYSPFFSRIVLLATYQTSILLN